MAQPVRSNHDDATLLVVVCLVREWFTDLSNDFISTATAAQPGERVLAETPSTKGDRPVSPDSLDESRNRLHQLSIFGSRVESGLMNFDLARKLTLRKVGRINGPSDFDKLVAGFKKMRCVTYVARTEDILRLFDQGLESLDLVLGYQLEDSAEDAMRSGMKDNVTSLDRLLSLYQANRFVALLPKRREHSKYYILENDETIRFVFTSYNLSGSRQGNLFIRLDYPSSKVDEYRDLLELYESIRADCVEFPDLRKLAEHVGDEAGEERSKALQVWVTAESESDEEEQDAVSLTIKDIVRQALVKMRDVPETEPLQSTNITIRLPADPAERRKLVDATRQWVPQTTSIDELTFDPGVVLASGYVETSRKNEVVNWPSAWIRRDERLIIGFHGERRIRTADDMSPEAISRGLKGIERYIETIDRGQTASVKIKERAKAMMGETLLFMFSSPLFNSWNRRKRTVYPDRVGPPDLVVTGQAGNGKTRFMEYCLKLMVGEPISTLLNAPETLSMSKVRKAIPRVLSFPLVFDEVHGKKLTGADMAALIRSLWEVWWSPDRDIPALVCLGNDLERKDWMARRVKFVDYEVHFVKNEENERLLGSLFAEENDIYRYFTRQYFEEERKEMEEEIVSLDALHTARATIRALYRLAGLGAPPLYFLDKPVEAAYDIGRERWIQAIEHGQIDMIMTGNPWFADFKSGMDRQIDEYRGFLVGIKHRKEGNRLVLEVPDTFQRWIGNDDAEAGRKILLDAIGNYEREKAARERKQADRERQMRRQTKPRGLRRLLGRRGDGS